MKKSLFLLACLFHGAPTLAMPMLSPDGSTLTGVEVSGYGLYDVMFEDGIFGDVYAGVVFDVTREAEANAVSAAIASALNALTVTEPDAIAGCGIPDGGCMLFNPDSTDGVYLIDNDVARWDPIFTTPPAWVSAVQGAKSLDEVDSSDSPIVTLVTYSPASDGSVPVPATLALFGLGLAGLGWSRRRKA